MSCKVSKTLKIKKRSELKKDFSHDTKPSLPLFIYIYHKKDFALQLTRAPLAPLTPASPPLPGYPAAPLAP